MLPGYDEWKTRVPEGYWPLCEYCGLSTEDGEAVTDERSYHLDCREKEVGMFEEINSDSLEVMEVAQGEYIRIKCAINEATEALERAQLMMKQLEEKIGIKQITT